MRALNAATVAALREPAVRARLASAGLEAVTDSTPESARAFLDRELARFREAVSRAGLRVE